MRMQAALQLVYPPQCLTCDALVTTDFGLCGDCWRETPFISGLVCDKCGTPLPGENTDGHAVHCDDCLTIARPWERGRAAMLYKDNGRRIVLSLKHGDRIDLARPAAGWMHRAAAPILLPDMVVAPVPLHWIRMFKRRYNQAALLSGGLAKSASLIHCPDLLVRRRNTRSQEGRDRNGRFENLIDAISVNPKRSWQIVGRPVLLIDDVMTSGATLAACTEACLAFGASQVSVLVLARVAKDV
ncbi:MAG: ComF family protein [Paracoccaceae bacterium]